MNPGNHSNLIFDEIEMEGNHSELADCVEVVRLVHKDDWLLGWLGLVRTL